VNPLTDEESEAIRLSGECLTVSGWIKMLTILGKYATDGRLSTAAEHDVVYLGVKG